MLIQRLIENKKKEIARIGKFPNLLPSNRNFKNCLKGKNNIIAEIKRKSPSELKNKKIDLAKTALIYERYANAISVVTDQHFFGGELKDISIIKQMTELPILRKDFIIDEKQISESRYYGADAILLIASILSKEKMDQFIKKAREYNMDCLVEIHDEKDLLKVLKTSAEIIGINNRNLKTMEIDLTTTIRLMKLIPENKIVVSESGFTDRKQIEMLIEEFQEKTLGRKYVNAFLIGSAFMNAKNLTQKLQSMRRTKVKICGITNIEDAKDCIKLGIDFLGFNFCKNSPRYIEPKKARKIISLLPNNVVTVGIFVNEKKDVVEEIIKSSGVDMIQFHGEENLIYCSEFSLPVIKAFRINNMMPKIEGYHVFANLFDTYDEQEYGGTGKSFDKSIIKTFCKKMFISGGLSIENIKDALRLDPYCIDICSGVEKEKGKKDRKKIEQLMNVVNGYCKIKL